MDGVHLAFLVPSRLGMLRTDRCQKLTHAIWIGELRYGVIAHRVTRLAVILEPQIWMEINWSLILADCDPSCSANVFVIVGFQ